MNHNQMLRKVLLEIADDKNHKEGAIKLLGAMEGAAALMLSATPGGPLIKGLFALARTVSAALKNTAEIDKISLDELLVESADSKLSKRGIDEDKINKVLNG